MSIYCKWIAHKYRTRAFVGEKDERQVKVLILEGLIIREIKNAIRMTQAMVQFNEEPLRFGALNEVLDIVSGFGDLEGVCECVQRKVGYFSKGERANYLKALFDTLPLEHNM